MATQIAVKNDRLTEEHEFTEAEMKVAEEVMRSARGIHHGSVTVIIVKGKPARIVRQLSELFE